MIFEIFWVVLILFIWFETDAFVQYCKAFRLSKLLKINDWEEYKITTTNIGYLDYILIKHKGFFTKLVSCQPCLTFWITIIVKLFFISSFNFFVATFPITYILSYVIYKIIKKYVN